MLTFHDSSALGMSLLDPITSTLHAVLMFLRRANWWYVDSGTRACSPASNAYATTLYDSQQQDFVTIGPFWTRGLVVRRVGTRSFSLPHTLRS